MTVQKGETFEKRVAFKATDDERRVATGGVLVPSKVDLQGDWLESDLIRELADDFMARLQDAGDDVDAVPGVMHAVFPPEHVTLVENRVLEEDETIGGKEFPAGSWIQSWRFDDDELWSLVDDGILSGYSIGGIDVKWAGPYEQSELPDDVDVAEGYPDDEPAWQIVDGTIAEVSSVDIPAVPDAVMASVKAASVHTREKNVLDRVEGKDEFLEVMAERGHDEEGATRMWDYLQRAADEGADQHPAEKASDGVLRRVGRAALNAFGAGSGRDPSSSTAAAAKTTDDGTPSPEAEAEIEATAKEGRTLSRANQERLFATIDASLDVLEDAGVDHGLVRFTDRDDVDWTLDDHTAREWATDEEDETPPGISFTAAADSDDATKEVTPEQAALALSVLEQFTETQGDAPVGDFEEWLWNAEDSLDADELTAARSALSDFFEEWRATELTVSDQFTDWLEQHIDSTTTMSNDDPTTDSDDPDKALEDAPEWAKALYEQTQENSKAIDELTGDGDPEKDAADPADPEKDGDDPEKGDDEPPEWAKAIQKQTAANAEQIENLAKASGHSQQLEEPAQTETTDDRKFSSEWDKTFGIPSGAGTGGDN